MNHEVFKEAYSQMSERVDAGLIGAIVKFAEKSGDDGAKAADLLMDALDNMIQSYDPPEEGEKFRTDFMKRIKMFK